MEVALGQPDEESRCVPVGLASLPTPTCFATPTPLPPHDETVTASQFSLPSHSVTVLGAKETPSRVNTWIKTTVV